MVSILEYKERDIANKQLWPFMGTVMIKTLFASIVLLASLGLSGNALAGTLLNLNYSDFSSTNGLTLLGTAQQVNGNALQLTTNGVKNSAGGVFFNTPVGVSRFNAEFTFQFFNTFGADGMAFVIKNADSWGTGAGGLGEYGGALGYGGGTNGIQKSVGIEFDSSVNTKDPRYNDIDGNHIGIDTNGSMLSLVQSPVSTTFNIDKGNGVWHAWVDYDGTVLTVSVDKNSVKPGTAMLSRNMDIQSIVGSSSGLMGFTAATGSNMQTTQLLSFRESAPNPEPSTSVLMSVGAVVAVIAARRKMLNAC